MHFLYTEIVIYQYKYVLKSLCTFEGAGVHNVSLADLKVVTQTKLASNVKWSFFCLPSTKIMDVYHHAQ